jgi:hypothetical protein
VNLCDFLNAHTGSLFACFSYQPHLQSDGSDSDVKIADFGFAKRVEKPKSLTTQCGTPGYVSATFQIIGASLEPIVSLTHQLHLRAL